MKINIERLIGAVQEHFDNEQSYILPFRKKKWWQMNDKEQAECNWHERNRHGSSNEVSDLCAILGMDMNRLYTIARLARKWEKKHNWEKCFPVQEHEKQIMEYLAKEDASFPNTEIGYIHWKINKKQKDGRKAA